MAACFEQAALTVFGISLGRFPRIMTTFLAPTPCSFPRRKRCARGATREQSRGVCEKCRALVGSVHSNDFSRLFCQAAIKDHITDLMIRAPPRVRVQLSEALSIISQHDFPKNWPGLLPKLIERLASTDPQVLNGVLTTADSIFMRYRSVETGEGCAEGDARDAREKSVMRLRCMPGHGRRCVSRPALLCPLLPETST